jgi:hyperosmotically inducible periplasmic protein
MKKQYFSLVLGTALIGLAAHNAVAQTPSASTPNPNSVPADNTKANKVDSTNTAAIADAQKEKENANDRTIAQTIRKSVMADESLSTYAHNVKIVSVDGIVTLNGVVRSDQEKASVEANAVAVVGQTHVVNDLKVAPKP